MAQQNKRADASNNTDGPINNHVGVNLTRLYSTSELSKLTGLTVSYFEAARLRGGGPLYIKLGKRVVRYSGQAILDWIDAGRRSHTAEGGQNV